MKPNKSMVTQDGHAMEIEDNMSNNSIVEHRANYYFLEFREEFLVICKECSYKKEKSKASPYCKALILAILEGWTNDKRGKGEDLAIYMTYPQWVDAMYGMFGRCVVIDSLDELIGEGLTSREKYRMYGKDTYKYLLNYRELNKRIKLLPERDPKQKHPKIDASTNRRDSEGDASTNRCIPSTNRCDTRLKVDDDPSKSRHNIESTKKPNIETTESTYVADEIEAQTSAPIVAPSPSSLSSLSSEETKPKASSKKKKVETTEPKGPPEMPPADMPWGTRKCLMLFDAFRGKVLISQYQLQNASKCARGLAEQYSEEEVRKVYEAMSKDEYWINNGGVDICNVANNIHKEIKKVNKTQVVREHTKKQTEPEITAVVSDDINQQNIARMIAFVEAKRRKQEEETCGQH